MNHINSKHKFNQKGMKYQPYFIQTNKYITQANTRLTDLLTVIDFLRMNAEVQYYPQTTILHTSEGIMP